MKGTPGLSWRKWGLPYPILRRMSSPSQSRAALRYALLRPLGRARPGWGHENAVYTPYPFPASARHVGLRPRTGQCNLQSAPFSSGRRQSDRGCCLMSLYKAVLLECWLSHGNSTVSGVPTAGLHQQLCPYHRRRKAACYSWITAHGFGRGNNSPHVESLSAVNRAHAGRRPRA